MTPLVKTASVTATPRREPKYHTVLVIQQQDSDPVFVDMSKNSVSLLTISDADYAMLTRGAQRVQDCLPMCEITLSDTTFLSDENTHEVI